MTGFCDEAFNPPHGLFGGLAHLNPGTTVWLEKLENR